MDLQARTDSSDRGYRQGESGLRLRAALDRELRLRREYSANPTMLEQRRFGEQSFALHRQRFTRLQSATPIWNGCWTLRDVLRGLRPA